MANHTVERSPSEILGTKARRFDQPISTNEELNKLAVWITQACVRCGRKYPETVLNIEGVIHHGEIIRCVDTKKCNRYVRRIPMNRRTG